MAVDRLVIEIEGNATGLTRALDTSRNRLTAFNTNVAASNRALVTLTTRMNTSASAFTRLTTQVRAVGTTLSALGKSATAAATGLNRIGTASTAAATSIKSLSTAANASGGALSRLATRTSAAATSMTSLNRRLQALMATVSATNAAMRTLLSSMGAVSGAANVTNITINNYNRTIRTTTAANGAAAASFSLLNGRMYGLAEGFRRSVAQLTALRTLTYQAIFWFSPMLYLIISTNAQLERQMMLLSGISRQQTEAARQMEAVQNARMLRSMAARNPFSQEQITDSFVKLTVARVNNVRQSLQTLMDSIARFGGSNSQLERASVAIQQMAGKGVISLEELRQQLGEHIPDAADAMAQGMGVSLAEMYDAIKEGNVESTQALNQMFQVLRLRHEGAAERMMNTWTGLIARLQTGWQAMWARLLDNNNGQNAFIQTLKNNIEGLIQFMNTPSGNLLLWDMTNALAAVTQGFINLVKLVWEWRDEIVAAARVILMWWGARLAIAMVATLATITRAAAMVSAALMILIGRAAGARMAKMLLGREALRAALSLGIFRTAAAGAAGSMATMAARAFGLIGVMVALAATIWAVVRANNALAASEGRARAAQRAGQGEGWSESGEGSRTEWDSQWTANESRISYLNDQIRRGNETRYRNAPYMQRMRNELQQRLTQRTELRQIATRRNINTGEEERAGREQHIRNRYQPTFTAFEDENRRISQNARTEADRLRERGDNEGAARVLRGAAETLNVRRNNARNYLTTRIAAANAAGNTDEARVLSQELEQYNAQDDYQPGVIGAGIRTNGAGEGGGSGRRRRGEGETDPNAGLRSRYQNITSSVDEMKNELSNLRTGADEEFDTYVSEVRAEMEARGKSREELERMIAAREDERRSLRQSIAIQREVNDLNNETADKTEEVSAGFDTLERGYESITDATRRYGSSLLRENEQRLQQALLWRNNPNATATQARQYQELTTAIDNSVRARQAELVLQAAQRANQETEEFRLSMMTPRERRAFEYERRRAELLDAVAASTREVFSAREELAEREAAHEEAMLALEDARARAAEATGEAAVNSANEQVRAAEQVVVVTGQLVTSEQERIEQFRRGNRYLQERLELLKREQEFRERGGPLAVWARDAVNAGRDIKESFGDVLVSSLDRFIDSMAEGEFRFGEFVKSIMTGLLKIILRAIIAQAILSALGLGGVGAGGAVTGPVDKGLSFTSGISLNHSGGIAGAFGGATKSVPGSIFDFAQRYHTGGIVGLRHNEVPIIAERGEGVFTREQMQALGGGGASPNVQVNVINQTGTQAEVERKPPRFDGEKWVEEIILKKMTQPGPVRDTLGAYSGKKGR